MDDTISFRPLARLDFPLLHRWLAQPHVVAWWNEPLDLAAIEKKYGPRVDGIEPTHTFIIEYGGQPIGWIQWYRWSDYRAHAAQLGAEVKSAGIDLAIGEQEMTGRGLGPRVIRQFLDQFVFADCAITAVVSDPGVNNVRSVRAFEKAGFNISHQVKLRGEEFQRYVVRLERRD